MAYGRRKSRTPHTSTTTAQAKKPNAMDKITQSGIKRRTPLEKVHSGLIAAATLFAFVSAGLFVLALLTGRLNQAQQSAEVALRDARHALDKAQIQSQVSEVQERLKPRELTDEAVSAMIRTLSPIRGVLVTIENSRESEPSNLATALKKVFERSGWRVGIRFTVSHLPERSGLLYTCRNETSEDAKAVRAAFLLAQIPLIVEEDERLQEGPTLWVGAK